MRVIGSIMLSSLVVGDPSAIVLEKTPDGWRIVHIHWSSHHQEARKP